MEEVRILPVHVDGVVAGEVRKRYGADYRIETCDDPRRAAEVLEGLAREGCDVALVLAGFADEDADGLSVLGAVRLDHPLARRGTAWR